MSQATLPGTNYEIRGPVADLLLMAQAKLAEQQSGKQYTPTGPPEEWLLAGPRGTSKTWGLWCLILFCANAWPGSRILICRKTRASLTQSVCVTLEKIVGSGATMIQGAGKENRQSYWVNGTEIVLGSLENTDRLYSTEWDIIWVEEAREISRNAWEKFLGNMRNFKMPFRWLIASTNPDAPGHWLRQRCKQGRMTYMRSNLARGSEQGCVHRDNPAYWNTATNKWTPAGNAYLAGLRRYTGNEYRRMYLGEWCAAEGAVWPNFDPEIHTKRLTRDEDGWVPENVWRDLDIRAFYAGYDPGWDAGSALNVLGMDSKRHVYQVAEVYRRMRQPRWWAERVVEIHRHYPLELIFTDPSRPDAIAEINEQLGVPNSEPGAIAIKANNDVFQGLSIVRDYFEQRTISLDPFALRGGGGDPAIDATLESASLPTCVADEIPRYVYQRRSLEEDDDSAPKKDEPRKQDDHGCDALRYALVGVRYLDPPEQVRIPIRTGSLGHLFRHQEWMDRMAAEDEESGRNEVTLWPDEELGSKQIQLAPRRDYSPPLPGGNDPFDEDD